MAVDIHEPSAAELPNGVKSQLSHDQEKLFDEFKISCIHQGLLNDAVDPRDQSPLLGIDDDASLLRFLSARGFHVQAAIEHFREARQIREVNKLCDFYDSIDVDLFQETRVLYPHWTGRRGKRGQPLCFFDISKLTSAALATHTKSSKAAIVPTTNIRQTNGAVSVSFLRACAVHDELTRFIMPLCSAVTDRAVDKSNYKPPITKQLVIADISRLGLRQIWQLKGHLESFSKLLALNYPEILDRVLVIGAPSYISTIYALVKKWIDPITLAKLQLVPHDDVLPTLESLIDTADIPTRYGGKLEFEAGMAPDIDEMIRDILHWPPTSDRSLPNGPLRWETGMSGSRIASAVGTADGKLRNIAVATLS